MAICVFFVWSSCCASLAHAGWFGRLVGVLLLLYDFGFVLCTLGQALRTFASLSFGRLFPEPFSMVSKARASGWPASHRKKSHRTIHGERVKEISTVIEKQRVAGTIEQHAWPSK